MSPVDSIPHGALQHYTATLYWTPAVLHANKLVLMEHPALRTPSVLLLPPPPPSELSLVTRSSPSSLRVLKMMATSYVWSTTGKPGIQSFTF